MKHVSKNINGLVFGFLLALNLASCTANEFEHLQDQVLVSLRFFDQSFDQLTQAREIDLLVVVDNSRSMRADQEKLGREFANFVSGVSHADYRIGVITTDVNSPGFENAPGYWGNLDRVNETGRNYISKADSNPEELFSNLINRQETIDCTPSTPQELCPSFDERPLHAIRLALDKRDGQNAGFFRTGADLAVVIITDEDETAGPGGVFYNAGDLIRYVEDQFSGRKRVLGFSIAIQDQDIACFNEQALDTVSGASAVSYGVRVGEFATLTGGFNVNICNQNFGRDLSSISDYVQQELLPFVHELPNTIVLDSIRVSVELLDGRTYESDYSVDESGGLSLVPSPPQGSKINIQYNY